MSTDINISNYEEYLLSYIDGELAGDARAALEQFLERHPAIKQELALLESTKLRPEEDGLRFGNKSLLYRGGPIHQGNYETYLLSYIDNELSADDKTLFEQYLRQHPQVKQEMLLWHATRQYPDTAVVFENKASLYRTAEAKTRRLRPVYWWSAAAAVVAGLLIWQLPREVAAPAPEQMVVKAAQPVQKTDEHVITTPSAQLPDVNKVPEKDSRLVAAKDVRPAGNRIAPKQPVVKKEVAGDSEPTIAVTTPIASVAVPDQKLATEIVTARPSEVGNNMSAQINGATNLKEPNIVVPPPAEKTQETALAAAPAPIQGELFMSVSSSGESKIMNGVTNVARFLSKKKK